MSSQRYFGKYRGKVENNVDVTGCGKVQVSVPGVVVGNQGWATPCSPYAGPGVGFFAVPPNGASVWVEFERGDPDYPVLAGCFWELNQAPTLPGPLSILKTVLKTEKFTLEADHTPGVTALTFEMDIGGVTGKASIVADMTGLTIKAAGNTIALAVDGVSINNTNLKIMK